VFCTRAWSTPGGNPSIGDVGLTSIKVVLSPTEGELIQQETAKKSETRQSSQNQAAHGDAARLACCPLKRFKTRNTNINEMHRYFYLRKQLSFIFQTLASNQHTAITCAKMLTNQISYGHRRCALAERQLGFLQMTRSYAATQSHTTFRFQLFISVNKLHKPQPVCCNSM